MANNEQSLKTIGSKTIITVLISIALNPISIFIGYYLGKTLEAPRLELSYAEISPINKPIEISESIARPIQGNQSLSNFLLGRISIDCNHVVIDRIINPNCFDQLSEAVSQLIGSYEHERQEINSIIDNVMAWSTGQNLITPITIVPGLREKPFQTYVSEDKQGTINQLKSYIKNIDLRLEEMKVYKQEITRLNSEPNLERTGETDIYIGVLNSGDSDGVIFPKGKLLFGDSSINIETAGLGYVVVKAHSFSNIKIQIDDGKSTQGALNKWKSLLKNHNQDKFVLEMSSPSNELRYTGRLPE
jgi:hypothetical protein